MKTLVFILVILEGSEIYDDTWERFLLVCKPEQSGKTFVMIQNIIKGIIIIFQKNLR